MFRFWNVVSALALLGALGASSFRAGERGAGTVLVRVTETKTGKPLPCRLTIVDSSGNLVAVQAEKSPKIAVRPGVIYTATGEARFTAPPGRYTVYATRGFEYSLASHSVTVNDSPTSLQLTLAREVNTDGYVSCDTHIHTLTYSGHGDCTIEERMVTLAGEGIELPIATEHNRHSDYSPTARATGTEPYFTPVIGNEVTTGVGHFNAFPIRAGSPVPAFNGMDRKRVLDSIRATPEVGVVILNHPNDLHANFRPTDPARFHPISGESLDGSPWTFDGMEVINSSALQSDFMRPYRDWFALLNRGQRMVGIGASDSHDVNSYIVGQARTYIASAATRPDRIDVKEACDNLRAGRALVSMGLLTEAWVDNKFGVGDLATGTGKERKVRVRVQGPRWITADRVEVYANGQKVVSRALLPPSGATVKADLTFTLPRLRHDVWLVAIASGPGITVPYWPMRRPYQPTRADWEPRVVGSTSPIRIDGDGDGRYSSPLDYARAVVEKDTAPPGLMRALEAYDHAVAVQAAALCRAQDVKLNTPPFQQAINDAAPAVRQAFVAYQNLLPESWR
jgi:hypothetical protein